MHGFTASIRWTFQPGNTALERHCPKPWGAGVLEDAGRQPPGTNNFANLQASWVTQGLARRRIGPAFRGRRFWER